MSPRWNVASSVNKMVPGTAQGWKGAQPTTRGVPRRNVGSADIAVSGGYCETFGTVDGALGTPGTITGGQTDFGPPTAVTDHVWEYASNEEGPWRVVDGALTAPGDSAWEQVMDAPLSTQDQWGELDILSTAPGGLSYFEVAFRVADTGFHWYDYSHTSFIVMALGTDPSVVPSVYAYWVGAGPDGGDIGDPIPFDGGFVGHWRYELEADLTVRWLRDGVLVASAAPGDWFNSGAHDWDGPMVGFSCAGEDNLVIDNFCWGDL